MHLGKVLRTENVVDIEDVFTGTADLEVAAEQTVTAVKEFAELS